MTHHVQFPPYLSQDKIDVEPHPVDAVERPVLGLKVPGIEHHVLAVVQLILRQKTPLLNGNASRMEKSSTTSSPDLCVCGVLIAHKRILPIYPGERTFSG
jgi:hypothetical protein